MDVPQTGTYPKIALVSETEVGKRLQDGNSRRYSEKTKVKASKTSWRAKPVHSGTGYLWPDGS
jgi:hypothetical protein